jgi:hypothetical protein
MHPDCLVLSEVNPAASVIPVVKQAVDWLNLIDESEVDQFLKLSYAQQIALLGERAKTKGKTLIIRDWVTVNYLPNAGHDLVVPRFILEQSIYLAHARYALQPLVVTRRAQKVYQSIRRTFTHLSELPMDVFSAAYLNYARAVSTFPKVSLESLQACPREALFQILNKLELSTDFIDKQIESFADFRLCTGNNTLTIPSTTTHLRKIVAVEIDVIANNESLNAEEFIEADRLMGYEV